MATSYLAERNGNVQQNDVFKQSYDKENLRPGRQGSNRKTLGKPSEVHHEKTKGTLVYIWNDQDGWMEGTVISTHGNQTKVKLDTGQEILVRADDMLLRTGEISTDVSDLVHLSPLHQATMFHCLRERFRKDVLYTTAGSTVIAFNPFKSIKGLYNNATIAKYHQFGDNLKDLSPHVYKVGQEAYGRLKRGLGKVNQAVIVSGESGAGKTVSAKHVMRYLTAVSNSGTSHVSAGSRIEQKVLDSNPILEAFGNASTTRNHNSSRFGKFIQLQFQRNGCIDGAAIETYLLEKTRVVHQSPQECNFHIFYQMLQGLNPNQRETLLLDTTAEFRCLPSLNRNPESDLSHFQTTCQALHHVGLEEEKQLQIFKVLSAVLHITNIDFLWDDDEEMCSIQDCDKSAEAVCHLLDVSGERLARILTFREITASHSRRKSVFHKPCSLLEARSRRDCLAKTLYSRLFDWLVEYINRQIASTEHDRTIGLLDIYGFEQFQDNSLEQLCINYANERLQQHFVAHFLRDLQMEYENEAISWSFTEFIDNTACLQLLEGTPGLFSLFNEECSLNRPANDSALSERLQTTFGGSSHYVLSKRQSFPHFTVKHYAATVQYKLEGLLDKNKDNVPLELLGLLQSSHDSMVEELFRESETIQPGKKKKTVLSKFKVSLDSLLKGLEYMEPHYIRCIKPNEDCVQGVFDGPFVMEQLAACGVLETVQISKQAFPASLTYQDFIQRFGFIIHHQEGNNKLRKISADHTSNNEAIGDQENQLLCEPLDLLYQKQLKLTPRKSSTPKKRLRRRSGLSSVDHSRKCCATVLQMTFGTQISKEATREQFGRTKIFLKDGQLEQLECLRGKIVGKCVFTIQCAWRRFKQTKRLRAIVTLQSAVRGYFGRKIYRRLQDDKCLKTESKKVPPKVAPKPKSKLIHLRSSAVASGDLAMNVCDSHTENTDNNPDLLVQFWRNVTDLISVERVLLEIRDNKTLTYPGIPYLEFQNDLMSRRRMPRVPIKFHTKPSQVLKYGHCMSAKEKQCSLTDCLA